MAVVEVVDPYRVSVSTILQSANILFEAFQGSPHICAIYGVSPHTRDPLGLPQRINFVLKFWERMLGANILNMLVRENGRVVAVSSWQSRKPCHSTSSWILRAYNHLQLKLVHYVMVWVEYAFALIGVAPSTARKETQDYFMLRQTLLPIPQDRDSFLNFLGTSKSARNRGFGALLLHAGIDRIKADVRCDKGQGSDSVKLGLYAAPLAIPLYERVGFRVIGNADVPVVTVGETISKSSIAHTSMVLD